MVAPKIGETMCDPAAGTFGFGIAAYEFIRTASSSPEFIREMQRNGGPVVRRGLGDRLTPEQRRIASYLDCLLSKADAIRAAQVETQKELDALMPSVLAKAFAGEL
jgi:hypothetical protein